MKSIDKARVHLALRAMVSTPEFSTNIVDAVVGAGLGDDAAAPLRTLAETLQERGVRKSRDALQVVREFLLIPNQEQSSDVIDVIRDSLESVSPSEPSQSRHA